MRRALCALGASTAVFGAGGLLTGPLVAQTPAPAAATEPAEVSLALGASGPLVAGLQEALNRAGERLTADGSFGRLTKAAVERAQARAGLAVTGTADTALLGALGLSCTRPAPGAPAAPRQGTYLRAFPLGGPEYHYTDDFGVPRHQGSHQGIDIIAPRGAPIFAVADGRIDRLTRGETGLGGIWIWLEDDQGNQYYYAHLDTIVAGIEVDGRVTLGQQIATNGNTGDARYGGAHLHFEIHPGGGAAINGHGELQAVDPHPERGAGGPSGPAAAPITCSASAPTLPPAPAAVPLAAAAPQAATPEPERARGRVTLSIRQLRINQRISQAAVRRVNEIRFQLGGPPPPAPKAPGVVRLEAAQLRINQRISQAAVRRVGAIERALDGNRAAERAPEAGAREAGRVTLSAEQLLINQRISQAAVRRVNELRVRVEQERLSVR